MADAKNASRIIGLLLGRSLIIRWVGCIMAVLTTTLLHEANEFATTGGEAHLRGLGLNLGKHIER